MFKNPYSTKKKVGNVLQRGKYVFMRLTKYSTLSAKYSKYLRSDSLMLLVIFF